MAILPQFNFIEKRGDTLDYVISVVGIDLTQTGTQMWFTGARSRGQADNQAVWQKTITNGGIVVTSPTSATATLQPSDTATRADGESDFYDVQVKTAAGRIITLFEGAITFETDITQSTS
jgi:hypothetical protein